MWFLLFGVGDGCSMVGGGLVGCVLFVLFGIGVGVVGLVGCVLFILFGIGVGVGVGVVGGGMWFVLF